jgi:hypothetical protein
LSPPADPVTTVAALDPGPAGGFGLVSLLATLVILGVMAAAAVVGVGQLSGSPAPLPAVPTTAGAGHQSGAPSPALTPIGAALTAACESDAGSIDTAQQAFRLQSGAFAGTGVTAGGVVLLVRAGYLRAAPGNTRSYRITTGTSGAVDVTNVRSGATADFDRHPGICNGLW